MFVHFRVIFQIFFGIDLCIDFDAIFKGVWEAFGSILTSFWHHWPPETCVSIPGSSFSIPGSSFFDAEIHNLFNIDSGRHLFYFLLSLWLIVSKSGSVFVSFKRLPFHRWHGLSMALVRILRIYFRIDFGTHSGRRRETICARGELCQFPCCILNFLSSVFSRDNS